MDCIVPGHSVKSFCAAISCLTRVGKEIYFEFDPIDGLTIRALNDSKSAFCCFQFEPTYFLRCTLACFTGHDDDHLRRRKKKRQKRSNRKNNDDDNNNSNDENDHENDDENDNRHGAMRIPCHHSHHSTLPG